MKDGHEQQWFYDWQANDMVENPSVELSPPLHLPLDQPTPGPTGKVTDNWQKLLN